MDDWQKDFFQLLETMTAEFEQFFEEVSHVVEAVAEEVSDGLQVVAEEVQNAITTDIDPYWQDWFGPIVEIYAEFEEIALDDLSETTEFPFNPKLEATLENHPACMGCRYYHGQVYGGNLLVCGMHPYGWDGEHCPDWEGSKR